MSRSERLPLSDDRRGSDINVVNFSLIYQGLNIKAKCHMNHLPKQEHWPSGELRVDESRQVRLGDIRRCGTNPYPHYIQPHNPHSQFPILRISSRLWLVTNSGTTTTAPGSCESAALADLDPIYISFLSSQSVGFHTRRL
jgi:hypothetical protein